DRLVLCYVAMALAGAGYAVETAGSAAEALERQQNAAGSPFGLALVEVGLPGPGGLETGRRLRRADAGVRLLVLAGQPAGGGPDFLQKPFAPERLVEAVRRALAATGDGPQAPPPA